MEGRGVGGSGEERGGEVNGGRGVALSVLPSVEGKGLRVAKCEAEFFGAAV